MGHFRTIEGCLHCLQEGAVQGEPQDENTTENVKRGKDDYAALQLGVKSMGSSLRPPDW